MQLHLVGGFLGSGKTTAIIAAARQLMNQGLQVGVVTNDQGKYLVDTAFVRLADLPAVEVTGGCFCCNFNDLNRQLIQLIDAAAPDVVFAESVGSCADIVATVVKPLQTLGDQRIQPSSFSVFVDSRLLLRRVEGFPLPFSEDVVYIFDKQIEEAGLLVLNKIDLLSVEEKQRLAAWADARERRGPWRFQNSLSGESVEGWLTGLQGDAVPLPAKALEIDYDRYGRGEAQMAWLDATLMLKTQAGQGPAVVAAIIAALLEVLSEQGAAIGHLKFALEGGDRSAKISFTSLEAVGWRASLPELPGEDVRMLINMRAETAADQLYQYLQQALEKVHAKIRFEVEVSNLANFHPSEPRPTHRMQ